ncbi:MAG: VWA domain-containing protein, partial [Acidobacteriota bacterium]
EGRRGELFPVRSAAEEAQQSQRNVWELRGGVTLDAMNAIVTHLGGLREGRKSVLFVSQGPPVNLRSSNWQRMEDVVESANRGNVTIHTLDPRPLGASEFGGNLVLRRFSDETGGRAIHNTNNHAGFLDEVFADASAYYLVGYAPTRELADGKFHKIDVEVKRRGLRVVARRGYWAPRAEELSAPPTVPIAPAVVTALEHLTEPRGGRTAEVWIGFAKGSDSQTSVSVTWEPTTRTDTRAATRLEVEHLRADGSVDTTQSVGSRRADNAAEMARLAMAPGKTLLRFTTFDSEGDVLDRWPEEVTVPTVGEAPLSLATPRLLLARSAFDLRALRNATDAVPTASRRFRKSDRLLVELEYYSADGVPEVVVDLLNQKGEPLVTLPLPAPIGNRVRFEVPLQSLAASVYVMRFGVSTATHQAREHVSFQIVP